MDAHAHFGIGSFIRDSIRFDISRSNLLAVLLG